jgi:hypothetical protein
MPANTGSLSLRSDNRHRLPSDPFVAKDALAYSLSSHWLGDMVNFSDHRLGNMPRKQKKAHHNVMDRLPSYYDRSILRIKLSMKVYA